MPRSRSADPDGYVLETGRRGAANLTATGAALVDPGEFEARETTRAGAATSTAPSRACLASPGNDATGNGPCHAT